MPYNHNSLLSRPHREEAGEGEQYCSKRSRVISDWDRRAHTYVLSNTAVCSSVAKQNRYFVVQRDGVETN